MKILLHICCGPCALVPMRALLDEGHQVAGAFVNPNIHPYREFVARREAARQSCDALDIPMVHEDGYGLVEFMRAIVGREEERCPSCYKMRLDRVAELASALGFDGFSTTMLVSTQQDHAEIVRAGEAAAVKHGVEFVSRDFRPRVMDGVRESKERGLYRQQYCGCVYSEWERYREGG